MHVNTETIATQLFLLVSAHFLGDFTLQNNMIAKYKNPNANSADLFGPGNPAPKIWPWIISAHAFEHGGLVFLITHSLWLGLAETAVHAITDLGKCRDWYGYHADQCLHLAAKVVWLVLLNKGLA